MRESTTSRKRRAPRIRASAAQRAPGGRFGCLGENGVTIGSVGVHVTAYDPGWPGRFEAEQAILEQVLAPWLFGGIHHIGSTAVPAWQPSQSWT